MTVGHERTLTPVHALSYSPDLLIVGAAVRKFALSPVTRRWIAALGTALSSRPEEARPRAVTFITHALRATTTERKGQRLLTRLRTALGAERVHPQWISARVIGQAGPFHEGVEAAVMKEIDAVLRWVSG